MKKIHVFICGIASIFSCSSVFLTDFFSKISIFIMKKSVEKLLQRN
ncbi:hypothetical protein [Fusobacterium nucleatum]|nr:hypothetical protein [Fusobacterium nucleatum]WMS29752.1 hypothetical protein RDV57_01530 [Fusobacterium nucleatum]